MQTYEPPDEAVADLGSKGPTALRRYLTVLVALTSALGVSLTGMMVWLAHPFNALATPAQLAAIQAQRPDTVILPVDLRYNAAFKLPRVAEVQPDIVCFGSSRAGGFRAAMFAPHRFYNMSFTAWTSDQLLDIFERTTRASHPRVVILELDYFLFAEGWERWFATTRNMIYDRPFRYAMTSLGSFLRERTAAPDPFRSYDPAADAYVGPQSIRSHEGFRSDGSYVYSPGHVSYAQQRYRTAEFFAGTVPPDQAMSRRLQAPIAQLAELARERGIRVIAVQLPMIRAGLDLLDRDETYHARAGAWRDFESGQTRTWLANLGIPLFDLARSPIDDDPDNFVDAIHLSERGMDKAMQELKADPAFREAINPTPASALAPWRD